MPDNENKRGWAPEGTNETFLGNTNGLTEKELHGMRQAPVEETKNPFKVINGKKYNFVVTNLKVIHDRIPNLLGIADGFFLEGLSPNSEVVPESIKVITGDYKDIHFIYDHAALGTGEFVYLSKSRKYDGVKITFNHQTQTLSLSEPFQAVTIHFSVMAPNDGKEQDTYII